MKYLTDSQAFFGLMNQLWMGLGVTLPLFCYTLIFSLPLGVIVALLRMSRFRPVAFVTRIYILVLRGTPLILQIFAIYFLLPKLLGHSMDRMFSASLAFVLNYAAYFAEIFRGGLESVPRGQREAGKMLGMSRVQVFFRILLPQMAKRCLLPVSNEVVTLVKDTALVTAIALCDMYYYAKRATSASGSLLPLFIAGALYLLMNTLVEVAFNRLNRRLDYYRG